MMTVLSAFLVLLCVNYSYQDYVEPYSVVHGALGSTDSAIVSGSINTCYKNYSNLMFDKRFFLKRLTHLIDVETCDAACQETENCRLFEVVAGDDYSKGCYLFRERARTRYNPLYSGHFSCDAQKKECIIENASYDRKHRIFFKRGRRKKYRYPLLTGAWGCQVFCKRYSGNNGFQHDDIEWGLTDRSIKEAHPDGKIPCAFYTYNIFWTWIGFCFVFAEGATPSPVSRIAGPTPECQHERETKLQNDLSNPSFLDGAGIVFNKNFSVGYFKNITNPEDCETACKAHTTCNKILLIFGMSHNSGCWLFSDDSEKVSVKSGLGRCSATKPECVTKDVTYGQMYEIILKPEYEFKGTGIEKCQEFCGAHSSYPKGFPSHQLDWDNTGKAIKKKPRYQYCNTYTYIDKPWFGKQCKMFASGAAQKKVKYRLAKRSITRFEA